MAIGPSVDGEGVLRPLNGPGEAFLAAAKFRVDVRHERDGVRVCPIGEVDLSSVEQLREAVDDAAEAGVSRLILDLRETTFFDSSGLHLAVETHAWATQNRTEFSIIAGPPAVQRTFEVANLYESLPFVDVP